MSDRCFRGDIPIPHRGHGDYGPVDTYGYAAKAAFISFDQIHQTADDHHHGQYCGQKYRDFSATSHDGAPECVALPHELRKFENTEYPEYSKDTDRCEKLKAGDGYQADIAGQDCKQVHYSEEA